MRDAPEVVLAEEDELLAEITKFRLELHGYRVTSVRTGETLVRHLSECKSLPQLLILDTLLPDTDAIDLVNRLGSDSRTHGIPILMLSSNADLDTVQRAYVAGARDYLVTPFDPTVLEDKVERLLRV